MRDSNSSKSSCYQHCPGSVWNTLQQKCADTSVECEVRKVPTAIHIPNQEAWPKRYDLSCRNLSMEPRPSMLLAETGSEMTRTLFTSSKLSWYLGKELNSWVS